jgi:outer membrane protein OmpA-like peptidoglycan-associated protein
MRCRVALAAVLVLSGVAPAVVPGAPRAARADPRSPIHVGYDLAHLDLDRRVLQFKPSRAVTEASLTVIGEDGEPLGTGSASYPRPPGGAWWPITWSQPPDTRVMKLKLRVVAADGVATNVELIPWSVTIDHDDVEFATDSSVIAPGERAKLDASLRKIEDVVQRAGTHLPLALYVAGHTDTVGGAAKNRKLSLDRAGAIARYFRAKQLALPILVAGFGEAVPKIPTPDETDERGNRRADYVLGPAGGAPPFQGGYLKVKADWKPLR